MEKENSRNKGNLMHDAKNNDHPQDENETNFAEVTNLPGIIALLGELKPGAIITEEGLASMFKRHVVSVKRAVQRGELPPPCRLFGTQVWTAGVLIRHIEKRLEHAAKDTKHSAQIISKLLP